MDNRLVKDCFNIIYSGFRLFNMYSEAFKGFGLFLGYRIIFSS